MEAQDSGAQCTDETTVERVDKRGSPERGRSRSSKPVGRTDGS